MAKVTNMKWTVWKVGLLGCYAAMVYGCTRAGIAELRTIEPSAADYRYEAEYIANATLVREDTSPAWQLGRYAFKRGTDGLLVLSRITSFADSTQEDAPRAEKVLERVWISLPFGTPAGEIFKLEELEQKFLVGYDEGRLDHEGSMFVQPNRVLGKLRIEQQTSDLIVVTVDMRVEPIRVPSWSYKGVLSVPVSLSGVRARPVDETETMMVDETALEDLEPDADQTPWDGEPTADQPSYGPVGDATEFSQNDPPTTQPTTDDQMAAINTPTTQPALQTAQTQPAGAQTQPSDQASAEEQAILGGWLSVSPRSKRTGNQYDVYLQLSPNGRFAHATVRGGGSGRGYDPGMKYGWWQVRGDYLILDVEKYVFEATNNNHLQAFGNDSTKYSYIILRKSWNGDKLVLTGDYASPMSDKGNLSRNLKLTFKKTNFPDLHKFRPKPNRKPGFDHLPEPEDWQIIGYHRVHHTKAKKKKVK